MKRNAQIRIRSFIVISRSLRRQVLPATVLQRDEISAIRRAASIGVGPDSAGRKP
jgi:hypothetical protein